MTIDDGLRLDTAALGRLLEESRDLHADAMHAADAALPELAEIGHDRAPETDEVDTDEVDTDEIDPSNVRRRTFLLSAGAGAGALGLLLAGLGAAPARADTALDVRILQTASSLEALAVALYATALGTGPDGQDAPSYRALAGMTARSAHDTLVAFFTDTMRQHGEHKKAFQAQAVALDGNAKVQDAPNPKFLAAVNAADVGTPDKLLDAAAQLEKVATDTYLLNLGMLQDTRTKTVLASVMAVEAQHLATLRAIGGLLKTDAALVNVPFLQTDLAKLPGTAGSAAFPDALEKVGGPDQIAEPTSGAVR
jgi:hypothetical protein